MKQNSLHPTAPTIPVIDYEGSQYKSDFWLGQGRDYEDATERLALSQLLPKTGGRIAEIGAGFGRLADLYLGYEQIILFDYSRTLLADAVKKWEGDPRFIFVAGNIYEMPLATASLDSLVMVRVMHHLANVPEALGQLERLLHKQSVAVLEYANKRNLKAILRWLIGKQQWSPFVYEPIEFVNLNFDFHPVWMHRQVAESSLRILRQFAVSNFRLPILKERVDPLKLARWDAHLFELGGQYPLAPSVFVKAKSISERERLHHSMAKGEICSIFRCPKCFTESFYFVSDTQVQCYNCNRIFANKAGIWDFKEAIDI